jgi:hypothetical protein
MDNKNLHHNFDVACALRLNKKLFGKKICLFLINRIIHKVKQLRGENGQFGHNSASNA